MPDDAVFSDVPRKRLSDLIARQGTGILNNPQAEATLRAACYGFPRESQALITAFLAGVPSQMLLAPGTPVEELIGRVHEHAGDSLSPETARWAVESWTEALAVEGRGSVTQSQNTVAPLEPIPPADIQMPYYAQASSSSAPSDPGNTSPTASQFGRPHPLSARRRPRPTTIPA